MCLPFSCINEPGHEKTCRMSYANNKGADQPAHFRSLISVFVVCCLDSAMSLVSVTKISSLMLASVAEQAGLSLTWSETRKDTFSHDKAQCKHNWETSSMVPIICVHITRVCLFKPLNSRRRDHAYSILEFEI